MRENVGKVRGEMNGKEDEWGEGERGYRGKREGRGEVGVIQEWKGGRIVREMRGDGD